MLVWLRPFATEEDASLVNSSAIVAVAKENWSFTYDVESKCAFRVPMGNLGARSECAKMVHRPEGAAEHEEVLVVWSDGIVWRVPGLLCRDINEAEEQKKKRYHMTKSVIR